MMLPVDPSAPDGRGGHLGLVPGNSADAELSVHLKRVFVRVVPNVERFGTNARMLFQRILFDVPREIRTNEERATAYTDNPDTAQLHALLHRHQFPPLDRCSRDKLLVFRYVNAELSGHGSMLGHLSVALSAAFVTGRVMVVDEDAAWPFAVCMRSGGCPGGFMKHYFAPLSSCNLSHVSQPLASLPRLSEHEDAARVVVVDDDVALPAFRMRVPNLIALLPHEQAGLLRWFSATSAFVMRPSQALTDMVARQKLRLQLPARYISMHVRRGHKWVETAAQPLEDYIAEAEKLAALANTRHVLVATEDEGVIRQLEAYNNLTASSSSASSAGASKTRLQFHWTEANRRGLRISIPQAIRLGILSAQEENEVSLVNLELLQHGQALVATFSSGYGKRVLELMSATQNAVPLYVSLDHLWSP
eukprot:Tamp_16146.p1 GENE.Tamp_16146~~Tamp_16146.p1  ORF type:complete len:419 (+),score=58.57 Tamp_16146:1-1257(+)